ncbi:acyl-CoA thioesterase [Paracoccus marinaquae]|uniref:Acyl-CoA thioesterase n=1 Tax=Paracoccus marinaquae TaxID=2841926 RepID=A0ABS6APA4_9RHOB|nr:thioesterase family protein [Paracoccus marinaquae]MBU3031464.1 acyl-CoA thioesterase [Paracoccus marinaquae]
MTDREPPRSRDAYVAFQPIQTRWNDNDQFGHMYNVTYYELFDEAMNRCLRALGMLDHHGGDPIQVVVENGCTYFREVAYPDQPVIGLRVTGLGSSSCRIEMGMFRDGEHSEAARAHFILVTVDNATHRPVPTPEAQRDGLKTLMQP